MKEDYLDDLEQAKVEQFAADTDMVNAVKKVMLAWMYQQGIVKKGKKKADGLKNFLLVYVSKNLDLTNEQIGQAVRGSWQGLNALEAAFNSIDNFKPVPPTPPKGQNQAR